MSCLARKSWVFLSAGGFGLFALIGVAVALAPAPDPVDALDARFVPNPDNALVKLLAQPDAAPYPKNPNATVTAQVEGDRMVVTVTNFMVDEIQEHQPGPIVRLKSTDPIEFGPGCSAKLVAIVGYDLLKNPFGAPLWALDAEGRPLNFEALKALGWNKRSTCVGSPPPESIELVFKYTGDIRLAAPFLIPLGNPLESARHHFYCQKSRSRPGIFLLGVDRQRVEAKKNSIFIQAYGGATSTRTWVPDAEASCELTPGVFIRALSTYTWKKNGDSGSTQRQGAYTAQFYGEPGPDAWMVTQFPAGHAPERFSWHSKDPIGPYAERGLIGTIRSLQIKPNTRLVISRLNEAKRALLELPPLPTRPGCTTPDPLDWPIPETLRATQIRLDEALLQFADINVTTNLDIPMSYYPECRTLRGVLRTSLKSLTDKGYHITFDPASRKLSITPPQKTWWERLSKWVHQKLP